MTTSRISVDSTTRGYPFLLKEQLNENNEVVSSGELSFMEAEFLNYSLEEYFQEVKTYLTNYAKNFGTYSEESSLDRREAHENAISLMRHIENYLQPKWATEWQSRKSNQVTGE